MYYPMVSKLVPATPSVEAPTLVATTQLPLVMQRIKGERTMSNINYKFTNPLIS